MEVTATTWTYEGDDDVPTKNTEQFHSERAFVEAGYSEYIWSSFVRGMTDKWEEHGILRIPEWLASEKGFPYTEEDRTGSTDWCGYAAVTLDNDRETDKALYVDALRTHRNPILSGTNGLRSRQSSAYVPKSQLTMLTLTEEPMSRKQCWCCGLPLSQIRSSAMSKPTVVFSYRTGDGDEIRASGLLCASCVDDDRIDIDDTDNLEPCAECGTHDATCKQFPTQDSDDLYQWCCRDHRPERIVELREMTRENYGYL